VGARGDRGDCERHGNLRRSASAGIVGNPFEEGKLSNDSVVRAAPERRMSKGLLRGLLKGLIQYQRNTEEAGPS
jgi:hypothetical protein